MTSFRLSTAYSVVLLTAWSIFVAFSPVYAQTSDGWSQYKIAGSAIAAAYGKCSVTLTQSVTVTGVPTVVGVDSLSCTILGGPTLQLVAPQHSLLVADGTGRNEVIQPIEANCPSPGSCTLKATFQYSHASGSLLRSANDGLTEAVAAESASGGGIVRLTPMWRGTTNDILNTIVPGNVLIRDERTGSEVWYGGVNTLATPLWTINSSAVTANDLHSLRIGGIRYADQFPGVDCGARIQSADSDLGNNRGIIRVNPACGAITSAVTLHPDHVLQFDPGTYVLNATITLTNGDAIVGSNPSQFDDATTLQRTAGSSTMIQILGAPVTTSNPNGLVSDVTLRDFTLDGGQLPGIGVEVSWAELIYIQNVSARGGGNPARPASPNTTQALRMDNAVQDFWVQNSTFTLWGDANNPIVVLNGGNPDCCANGVGQITDGHWDGNEFGEIGNNNGILATNGFVLQQRFMDNKFHFTGDQDPFLLSWNGYRSAFLGNSFQGSGASTPFMVQLGSENNVLIGNIFMDVGPNTDGIQISAASGNQPAGVDVSHNNFVTPSGGTVVHVLSGVTSSAIIRIADNQAASFSTGIRIDGSPTMEVSNNLIQSGTPMLVTGSPVSASIDMGYSNLVTKGQVEARQLTSSVPTGTPPISVSSVTPVPNLSLGGGANTSVSTASLSIAGDVPLTASPRMVWSAFFSGTLTQSWSASSWNPDHSVLVSRLEGSVKIPPQGCSTNAVLTLAQGAQQFTLPIGAATVDSGLINIPLVSNVPATLSLTTPASGCTISPADLNVVVEYQMQ